MKNIVLFLLVSALAALSGCAIDKRDVVQPESIAVPTQISPYNRKDWPHWIAADHDCQNTRQEMLIATSRVPVNFKDARHCTVVSGEWFGVYTGKTFTRPSDVDIDHIVPTARLDTFRLSRIIDFFLRNRYLVDIFQVGVYDARENPFTTNSIPIS